MNKASYVALICILFFITNLPNSLVNQIRYVNISAASILPGINQPQIPEKINPLAFQKLQIENNRLKTQLEGVKEWIQFDQRIDELVQKYELVEKEHDSLREKEFFRRREDELCNLIKHYLQALPAKVIFRDPALWSSCFWINLGAKDNEYLERVVVALNSPVVVGNSLVGVIDYVGKKKSRVRLITDSALTPSVRVVREGAQNFELLKALKNLELQIKSRDDLFDTEFEMQSFLQKVVLMSKKIKKDFGGNYLAKGQLQGLSAPIWRKGDILKGIGFNYDYSDEEGPARDLRTGDSLVDSDQYIQRPILKEGDLLVTTGMDGVFYTGLNVAVVDSIDDLEEGGYAYSIKAKPCATNLQELEAVFVLPPLSEDESSFEASKLDSKTY